MRSAVISTKPAFPRPNTTVETLPPLVNNRDSVVIVTFPALPNASELTLLKAPLGRFSCKSSLPIVILPAAVISIFSLFPSPSVLALTRPIVILSVAVISTFPPFPSPSVLAITCPILVKEIVSVVILIFPEFPTAPELTLLAIMLLSTVTLSVALIVISPACASAEVDSAVIPASRLLLLYSPVKAKLRALTMIFPPPVPVTSTLAALLRVTSALATFLGKLRLPFSSILIIPAADKPPNSILPPKAVAFPASKSIFPPSKVRFFPGVTSKPIKSSELSLALERLTISLG